MRITTSVAALAALLVCSAKATREPVHGYVYTIGGPGNILRSEPTKSLSAATARLILAQRIGVEDYHITHGLTTDEVKAINKYGKQTKLFEGRPQRKRALFLAGMGVAEDNEDFWDMEEYYVNDADFVISDAPTYNDTINLWSDLLQQVNPSVTDASAYLYDGTTFDSDSDDAVWLQVRSRANENFDLAEELARQGVHVTYVMIRDGARSGTWGTYEMPNTASYLQKRAPRRLEEKPLSIAVDTTATPQIMASNSSSNHSNNKPFEGIVPACYTSQKACESKTRGCTGHGSCRLKYTNSASKNHPECWSCQCSATQSNGLTTYWAGPACQKKDISVEFWLVALFTVGLISLVTFAVGTIWNMGEQELPSVIGAGVSGPTARK